jgi:hypothetical protein
MFWSLGSGTTFGAGLTLGEVMTISNSITSSSRQKKVWLGLQLIKTKALDLRFNWGWFKKK